MEAERCVVERFQGVWAELPSVEGEGFKYLVVDVDTNQDK